MKRNGYMVIQEDLREFILRRNAEQSASYSSPSARLERQLYRAKHPTNILALKCMDGRLNLAIYTETPPGIIQPFRNIGGRFNLGWPFLQEIISESVNFGVLKGRASIVLTTYHFSKGSTHRGCAGFGYDTEAAKQNAFRLRDQFESVFGVGPVCPIVVGLETDEESLVFHGRNEELSVAELTGTEEVFALVHAMYPEMDEHMVQDLVPLIEGNFRHVRDVRNSNKELIDHEHREQIIGVGRGFDWLHMPNTALIIGPYSHEWPDAVATAGKIALGNIMEGRIPEQHGVLLLVTALSRDPMGSFRWNMMLEKAKYLTENSLKYLGNDVPKLMRHVKVLSGVVSAETRKLYPLETLSKPLDLEETKLAA